MLSVKNLNVFYGGIHALKGVTIDVQEGQIVSIIAVSYTHLTLPTIA